MESWLKELNKAFFYLRQDYELFKEISSIIEQNSKMKEMDRTALDWMEESGVGNLLISFGRICDPSKNAKSLVKFLKNLKRKENRDYLSRKTHITKNAGSKRGYSEEDANEAFDVLAGIETEFFPLQKIEEDIRLLTQGDPCKRIMSFRNEIVAHIGEKSKSIPFTFDELSRGFKIIETILKKYNTLITGEAHVSFTPPLRGYWQEVFTIPWIEEEQHP